MARRKRYGSGRHGNISLFSGFRRAGFIVFARPIDFPMNPSGCRVLP
jgi:hypothetical protein